MKPKKQQTTIPNLGGGSNFEHVVEFPQDIERANSYGGSFEDREREWLRRELRGVKPRRRAQLIRGNLMGPQL